MSRNIWVISDTHFNHANILTFKDNNTQQLIRRFSCVEEMDNHMIERWNSVVKPGDKVYHLGDVVLGVNPQAWMKQHWPRLHGSKRLIVGNHDDIKMLSSGGWFNKVSMWRRFTEFGLLLTHVPLHASSLNNLINVHGHIHQNASPEGPYRNVSVEMIDYTPVNIEDIRIK